MKKRSIVFAAALAAALSPAAMAAERISIGTGGTGGLFYVIGAGVAEVLNQHMPDATARAEVTGASVENIHRVAGNQMTFGFSSSSTLHEAFTGEGPFDAAQPVAAIAYLYPAVLQVAALADSGIESFADLDGRTINLGPPGSNSAVLGQRLLEAHGVFDPSLVQFLSYTEGTTALMNGHVDAAMVLAGAPTAALIDLSAQRDMRLLPVDEDVVSGLIEEYPFYQLYEIPAGTYPDQDDPIAVVNDPATLFTHADADEELIYNITSAIFGNLDQLAGVHPQAAEISIETAPDAPIELHPGAQRFFDEAAN